MKQNETKKIEKLLTIEKDFVCTVLHRVSASIQMFRTVWLRRLFVRCLAGWLAGWYCVRQSRIMKQFPNVSYVCCVCVQIVSVCVRVCFVYAVSMREHVVQTHSSQPANVCIRTVCVCLMRVILRRQMTVCTCVVNV